MEYSARNFGFGMVAAGLLGLGIGYNIGTARESIIQCRERGMRQLFAQDFPKAVRERALQQGATMVEIAYAAVLSSKWEDVKKTYFDGRIFDDYLAQDLVNPQEVASLGRSRRETVERACDDNASLF